MIKITNDRETKTVTKGAYNSFYKHLGFRVISINKMASDKVSVKPVIDDKKENNDENNVDTNKTDNATTKRK